MSIAAVSSREAGNPSQPPAGKHFKLIINENKVTETAGDVSPFVFAALDGRYPQPLGDATLINGKVTFVAELETPLSQNATLDFYKRQFSENDIHPGVGAPEGEGGPIYLTFLGEDKKSLNTITLVPHGTGTLVLASIGEVAPLDKAATLPEGLPHPSGVEHVNSNEVIDGRTREQSITFRVKETPLEAFKKSYQHELEQLGFSVDGDVPRGTDADVWRASFRREGETLAVTAKPMPQTKDVWVDLLWIRT